MITKAGVPASKVFIGVTSYGRSFRITSPSYTSPIYTYTSTRNVSNVYKGRYTDTAGYLSNVEIKEIIIDNP